MKHIRACLLIALMCANIALPLRGDGFLRTVAITGNHALSRPANVIFGSFFNPVLNEAGHVAFRAGLTGGEISNGIWSEGAGNGLRLVAREGGPAPGIANAVFRVLDDPLVLNDLGQSVFDATVEGRPNIVPENNSGLWAETADHSLRLAARAGNSAPGTNSAFNFLYFSSEAINDSGEVAFYAGLVNAASSNIISFGFWTEGGGGALRRVARQGDQAPNTPSGTTFADFENTHGVGSLRSVLNNSGGMAFWARLTGSSVDETNDLGIWTGSDASSLRLVARTGDPVTGVEPGTTFGSALQHPTLNDKGQVAFKALLLVPTGSTNLDRQSIWIGTSTDDLRLVARQGDHAPGTPTGVSFHTFGNEPVLNNLGETVFGASLTGPGIHSLNEASIWSDEPGQGLRLIAREGDPAPGTPIGVTFRGDLSLPVVNGLGQVAFISDLAGAGINPNERGIWAQDIQGMLQLIMRTGDEIDVDDGPGTDLRVVSNLSFVHGNGSDDGRPSAFNDRGQLAFLADFADGSSGIFVSNQVAIPEPACSLLAGLGICGVLLIRRSCYCPASIGTGVCGR